MDVGVEFSHYRVIEHIGRGGMADVWSARDRRLNRIVAIKTIARDITLEHDPIEMFEQEARTIAALEHPHILPIYDFGEYDRQLFIAMRYLSGGSLDDLLEMGPLTFQEVLTMARAVASALDYAHRSKVVHLDLKPSNILLDSQGSPYLADFGLAAVMDYEGRARNPGSGTLLYMAPEQVTSDLLDHRADIYSFCILLFHMLTGTLPYQGNMPLALQQLQMADELPDITTINPTLPYALNPLLRHGTMVDLESRIGSVMDVLYELEQIIAPSSSAVASVARPPVPPTTNALTGLETIHLTTDPAGPVEVPETMPLAPAEALVLREAADVYARARRAWAFGQGRFILGITDFVLINDFYSQAERHGLELDEPGMQMFLRGAVEYDYAIDFWWDKLGDESRRWVMLHAARGQNAAARARALFRLELLPDSDPPQIPKIVAQTLQQENNPAVRLAAIRLLAVRARLIQPRYDLRQSSGQLRHAASTLLTRTFHLWTPGEWYDIVYSPEIDGLLATLALDRSDPQAADAAARAIGRIRSRVALNRVASAQAEGQKSARRALALIRDEAPSLPGVPLSGRVYAWLANTWRRITDQPMKIVWRFVFAFLGAALGMAQYVWGVFEQLALFDPVRWKFTVSLALFFGFAVALLVVIAGEVPARLRGFWPWWGRLIASSLLGVPIGIFIWGLYTYLFLEFAPEWEPLIPAGIGLALGLIISSVYRLPGWLLTLITALVTYIPIYTAHTISQTTGSAEVLYVRPFDPAGPGVDQIISLGLPLVILLAIGAFARPLWHELGVAWSYVRRFALVNKD